MTTEVQEKPTLVLDGENHVIDDLSDKAKYLVGQLQDLQQQATQTSARADQIEVARQGFTTLLKEEIANPQPVEGEGELVQ
ncbi:MAG TPA: hypothetical protein DCW83_15075 [Saprospirales bacterium]|jgi:hypothetical protein|nr:hypothetical protein [Saprospirales bacterium]